MSKVLLPLAIMALITCAAAATVPKNEQTYHFLYDENKSEWCGYARDGRAEEIRAILETHEIATVTYNGEDSLEIIYQIMPDSMDWMLTDSYKITPHDTNLAREISIAEGGVNILQKGQIVKGQANHVKLISATRADGSKANADEIDIPEIEIADDPLSLPYVKAAKEMRDKNLESICTYVHVQS